MQGVMRFRDRRHSKGTIHWAISSGETTTGRQGDIAANTDDLIENATDEHSWKVLHISFPNQSDY